MAATETLRRRAPRDPGAVGSAPSPALAPPPGNPRFPLFDGLRALAVLGVLVYHASEFSGRLGFGLTGRFAEVAVNGVLLFFAISGFLLYRPYVAARARDRPGPATGTYARRRALRILPAYWTVLTLLAIYPGIPGVFSGDWWRYYGFLQLYSGRTLTGGLAVAWTLCVEVSFYIALPLWASAMRRLTRRVNSGPGRQTWVDLGALAALAAGGVAVQLAAARGAVGYLVATALPGECVWFAIGMAFAVVSVALEHGHVRFDRSVRMLGEHPGACWAAAACAFAGLMALVPHGGLFGLIAATHGQSLHVAAEKLALEGLLIVFLIVPAVFGDERRGAPRRLLRLRPVVWLGVITYSFYLWHLTILQLIATPGKSGAFSASGLNLMGHLHSARTIVLLLLSFAASAVVASISYRLVELPFLRRK